MSRLIDRCRVVVVRAVVLGGAIALVAAPSATAQVFSLWPPIGTPQLFTPQPDDVLLPGPTATGPSILYSGVGVGTALTSVVNVDAITFGRDLREFSPTEPLQFSVDLGSVGVAGTALAGEGPFDSGADIYVESPATTNALLYDGDGVGNAGIGSAGFLGLQENQGFAGDDVDGWDAQRSSRYGNIWFSLEDFDALARGVNGGDILVATPANLYAAPGNSTVWATAAQLGLDTLGANSDELDALVIFEDGVGGFTSGDVVLFSLADTSLSLGPANSTPFSTRAGGDVFRVDGPGGTPTLFRTASQLGIGGSEELDALDLTPRIIPEPSGVMLLALAVFSAVVWCRPQVVGSVA